MRILNITLATVAIQSAASATFTQKGGNAQSANTELASSEDHEADAWLIGSKSYDASRRVQEVLQNDGAVEDYKAVSQIPPILSIEVTDHSADPVDLAMHDESSAESSLHEVDRETMKKAVDLDFWGQSLAKALELAKVKTKQLQLEQIQQWVEEHPWKTKLRVADRETMEGLFDMDFWGQSLGKALELAKVKARELQMEQVAIDIERWVEEHPWKAAFYTASALGFFAPEILSIPALEALGFGVAGVRAGTSVLLQLGILLIKWYLGSIAAKVQSVIGPIAARSVFAIWQSARMGGYGVSNVNGGVRALIALTDAAMARCNPLKDCKGLTSGEARSTKITSTTIALAVLGGCLTGLIAASE